MPRTAIDQAHLELIVDRIRDRECVPFLGAGVNAGSEDYEGLKLGKDVARSLAEQLTRTKLEKFVEDFSKLIESEPYAGLSKYPDLVRLGIDNLARVAFHVQLAKDTPYLVKRLRRLLPDHKREPSELLRTLAQLPFPLIVTTNYDGLMEKALRAAGTEFLSVVQPMEFREQEQARLDDQLAEWGDRLVLYKIHGTFPGAGASGNGAACPLIVTEEDYIQFLTVVHAGIPQKIASDIRDKTLLFLGYSLEDWDFRTIFKTLVEPIPRYQRRASFAIQWEPSPFWIKFWSDPAKLITIYDADLAEFAHDLQDQWNTSAEEFDEDG